MKTQRIRQRILLPRARGSGRSCTRAGRENRPTGRECACRAAPRFPAEPTPRARPARPRRRRSNATPRRECGTAGRRSSSASVAEWRQSQLGRPSASGMGRFLMHRVARRRHPEQLLDPHDLRRAAPVHVGDDREIDVAVLHPLDEVLRRLAHHRHLGLGIGARKPRQDLRQIAVGVIVRQSEPHASDKLVVVERRHAFGVQAHDAARIVEQAFALVGELREPPVALENRVVRAAPPAASSAWRRRSGSCGPHPPRG